MRDMGKTFRPVLRSFSRWSFSALRKMPVLLPLGQTSSRVPLRRSRRGPSVLSPNSMHFAGGQLAVFSRRERAPISDAYGSVSNAEKQPFLFFAILDVQFPELFVRNLAWRFHHQILAATVLGKGDDISNIRCSCDEHDQAVDSQRDPSMRRRAECKGPQKVPKKLALLFLGYAKHIKHFCL